MELIIVKFLALLLPGKEKNFTKNIIKLTVAEVVPCLVEVRFVLGSVLICNVKSQKNRR